MQNNCSDKIYVTKCWNIISFMISNSNLAEFFSIYEQEFIPLAQLAQLNINNSMDDEILNLIKKLVDHSDKISVELATTLDYFYSIFTRNNQILGSILKTLNSFIRKGEWIFSTN